MHHGTALRKSRGYSTSKMGLIGLSGGSAGPGGGHTLAEAVLVHLWSTHSLWAPCVVHVMHLAWYARFLWFVGSSCQ